MDFLSEYVEVSTMVFCLVIGYIYSQYPKLDNKHLPLIVALLGVLFNCWIKMEVTPAIVVVGMVSGLSSTGMHQLFKQYLDKEVK